MVILAMDSVNCISDPFLFPKQEDYDNSQNGEESTQKSVLKLGEFYQHLIQLTKENPKKYSNLLRNIPFYNDEDAKNNEQILCGDDIHTVKRKDKLFLLKFLRAGNHDIHAATKILENYILQIRNNPKYYSSCLHPERIKLVFKEKIYTMLLHRDEFGRRVFIHRPGQWNPSNVSFTDCYCVTYMLSEMIALEEKTQIVGCTVITDGKNIGLKQLTSMGIDDIKNCAQFIQVWVIN